MEEFEAELKEVVGRMNERQRLFFVALTLEKMLPNYTYFVQETGWGKESVLEHIITLYYEAIVLDTAIQTSEVTGLYDELEDATPDTEEFEVLSASFALDTCHAFEEALHYLITRRESHLLQVASHSTNTIDLFVQIKRDLDPNDPLLDYKIDTDESMVRERSRQLAMARALAALCDWSVERVKEVRSLNTGKGPLTDLSELNTSS